MRKYIFLSFFLLIAGCSSVFAQRTNTPQTNRPGSPPPSTRNTDNPRIRNTDNPRIRNDRANEANRRSDIQRSENRSETDRQRPANIGRLLRGLELTDEQKQQTRQILRNARENNTPVNEVLRQINSTLNTEQSEKFKKKIKKIKKQRNNNGQNQPTDGDDSNP